jgi:hypothetical protein
MSQMRLMLAGAIVAASASWSSAQAAPIGMTSGGLLAGGSSLAEKVHGWHRDCAWGPQGYHRHVPGYGIVPCYRGPSHRCRAWRHECAARWGWGGWRYRRCLERHGCR